MKLPNHQEAIVSREKILDYLLSSAHPDGRHKATFFFSFGFNRESWQTLAEALRQHATLHEVSKSEITQFGVRYVVEGDISTPDEREPFVRAVRFIRDGHTSPNFVTAYPRPEKEGRMIKELDQVVLTADLPENGLQKGDVGTVVLMHEQGSGYEVEFVTLDGETVAVVTLLAQQVRSIAPREIAHARQVSPEQQAA